MSTWAPIFDVAESHGIIAEVARVAEVLPQSCIDLSSRAEIHWGDVALYLYLAKCTGNSRWCEKAVDSINAVIERGFTDFQPGLYGGLSGFGSILVQLVDAVGEDAPPELSELLERIDAILVNLVEIREWRGVHGLGRGLAGIALYFLSRGDSSLCRRGLGAVLARMQATAVPSACGPLWVPRAAGNGTDENSADTLLGVLDGVAGVTYVLGELYRARIAPEECRPLALSATASLLSQSRSVLN